MQSQTIFGKNWHVRITKNRRPRTGTAGCDRERPSTSARVRAGMSGRSAVATIVTTSRGVGLVTRAFVFRPIIGTIRCGSAAVGDWQAAVFINRIAVAVVVGDVLLCIDRTAAGRTPANIGTVGRRLSLRHGHQRSSDNDHEREECLHSLFNWDSRRSTEFLQNLFKEILELFSLMFQKPGYIPMAC